MQQALNMIYLFIFCEELHLCLLNILTQCWSGLNIAFSLKAQFWYMKNLVSFNFGWAQSAIIIFS